MGTALWLYLVLAATVFIQEEAAPLAGGLAAHHGHAALPLIVAACALGSWLGDLALFGIGRRSGRIMRRLPVARGFGFIQRHPRLAPLVIRFAYGLRWSLPTAAGAAGVPLRTYALYGAASAVLWSALYAGIGWGAGAVATRVFSDVEHYELPVIAAIALAWLAALARRYRSSGRHAHPARSAGMAA